MPPTSSEAEHEDGRLLEADAAEEEADDQHRRVGERGAEVGLLEHERHGDADQREGFADVLPGELAARWRDLPEEARRGEDEDELDPLGGLEVDAAAEVDPAPRAEDLVPTTCDGDQRDEADAIGPVGDVEQAVVVDHRDEEHQHEADEEEDDLLGLEAVELGHGRGGADFEHADDGEQETRPSSIQSKSRKRELNMVWITG